MKGKVVLTAARSRWKRMGGVQRQAGYTEGEVILTAAKIRWKRMGGVNGQAGYN